MLSIDDTFPSFSLKVSIDGSEMLRTDEDLRGNWSIIFFYPEDFSFICPTEVKGFQTYLDELQDDGTQLIGISVDDVDTHKQWAKKIGITYALASDEKGKLAEKVGVLDPKDNRAHRATFITDPELKVQFAMVCSRNVGRSVEETIRVYRAIQSGKKCPAEYARSK